MSLHPRQLVTLRDARGRDLGRVAIDRVEGDLVFGRFTPGPDYPHVEPLFTEYVEAANDQLLGIVGALDEQIGALGLHLCSPDAVPLPPIYDVQIGEGVITFRTRPFADGPAPAGRTAAAPTIDETSRPARPMA